MRPGPRIAVNLAIRLSCAAAAARAARCGPSLCDRLSPTPDPALTRTDSATRGGRAGGAGAQWGWRG
jgi:hypothetical protein